MDQSKSEITAIGALLISAIIIGFSYLVVKTGLEYASPFTVLIDRLLIALLVILLLKKTSVIAIEKIDARLKIRLFFLSQLYPVGFFLFQNLGMKHISASEASIIYSLIPVFTPVVSAIVLKEKTTLLQNFGILLSFLGMAYISFHSFNGISESVTGYILIFCSLLAMVFYYVFLKKSVAKISPLSVTYYLLLYAASSSFAIYLGWELINFKTLHGLHRLEHFNYVMAILYLGILSTLVTAMLTTVGIKNLSAVQASIFSNLSPLFGILAGVFLMGDILKTHQIIGAISIFTGMFISLKYSKKANNGSMKKQNIANLELLWILAARPFNAHRKIGNFNVVDLPFSDWPNKIWQDDDKKDLGLDNIRDVMRQCSAEPTFTKWNPLVADEHKEAKDLGLNLKSVQIGMSLNLETYSVPSLTKNVLLDKVDDSEKVILWSDVFRKCFGYSISYRIIDNIKKDIAFYLINDGFHTVGCVATLTDDNQLGVHSLGVLDIYRKQGFAEMTMHKLLQEAKNKELENAHLQASALGLNIYRKIGFNEIFKMCNYKL